MTDSSPYLITIDDRFTVMQASAGYLQLMQALVAGNDIELDLSQVRRIDTAAIQLLVSFSLEARRLGLSVKWQPASPVVTEALELAGIKIDGLSAQHDLSN